jgi:hypothetical protein
MRCVDRLAISWCRTNSVTAFTIDERVIILDLQIAGVFSYLNGLVRLLTNLTAFVTYGCRIRNKIKHIFREDVSEPQFFLVMKLEGK